MHSIGNSFSLKLFIPLCIKQYNALCRNELCCTALCYTPLCCTALCYTALLCTALCCTALHFTVLLCTVLHCTVLHCPWLNCTLLHCTLLHTNLLFFFFRNMKQCPVNQGGPCRKCLLIYCNNREFNLNHAINTKITGEDNDNSLSKPHVGPILARTGFNFKH